MAARVVVSRDRMLSSRQPRPAKLVGHQYVRIAAQAQSSVDFRLSSYEGCQGGPAPDTRSTFHLAADRQPVPTARNRPVSLLPDRLGDDPRHGRRLSWRFYAVRYGNPRRRTRGRETMVGVSGGDKHIFKGHDWKKDVISPNWRFITTCVAARSQTSRGSRRVRRIRSPRVRRRLRAVVGSAIVNTVGCEQVLELDGDLRPVGRLGRLLRPRCTSVRRLRR